MVKSHDTSEKPSLTFIPSQSSKSEPPWGLVTVHTLLFLAVLQMREQMFSKKKKELMKDKQIKCTNALTDTEASWG